VAWVALGDLGGLSLRATPPRASADRGVQRQQAVEKALKAALILDGVAVPRTHDLDDLRNRLSAGWRVRTRFPDLARLCDFAVDSRYPEDMTPVTPLQSAVAVRQAVAIIRIIREDFARRGLDTSFLEPR